MVCVGGYAWMHQIGTRDGTCACQELLMKRQTKTQRLNCSLAQTTWGELSATLLQGLEELTQRYNLSVALRDIQQIDGCWYGTHAGLLRIAQRRRCHGIKTSLQKDVSDPIAS